MKLRALPLALLASTLIGAACGEDAEGPARMTVEQLQDPESCKGCHPIHYREWKASMHAYATDDPVFIAMNKLGQRETDGELGDFCVKCHAPLATQLGLTDGSPDSIERLPDSMKGVTCYFCHNVESVDGDSNAQITLANDTVMRGALSDPPAVRPSAHGVQFSRFMNRYDPSSSQLCGGCHDIELDNGVHLERTFAEYQASVFADEGEGFASCSGCHMPFRNGLAAHDDTRPVPPRFVTSHLWPGVDVAITPWHDREAYEEAVQCLLDGAISVFYVGPGGGSGDTIVYTIETNMVGHMMPSGATQDRRLWVEMIAYDEDGDVVCSNGIVSEDESVVEAVEPGILCGATKGGGSDGRVIFRDRLFDESGDETHMFWRAATIESSLLPAPTLFASGGPGDHVVDIEYQLPAEVTKVTLRVKMRPMDRDVLDELVAAGVLEPQLLDEIPTFTIGMASAEVVFDDELKRYEGRVTPERSDDCGEKIVCAFDPDSPDCD